MLQCRTVHVPSDGTLAGTESSLGFVASPSGVALVDENLFASVSASSFAIPSLADSLAFLRKKEEAPGLFEAEGKQWWLVPGY